MTSSDLILYFANRYIAEKEKNIKLQHQLEHQKQQMQNSSKVKTNKH